MKKRTNGRLTVRKFAISAPQTETETTSNKDQFFKDKRTCFKKRFQFISTLSLKPCEDLAKAEKRGECQTMESSGWLAIVSAMVRSSQWQLVKHSEKPG